MNSWSWFIVVKYGIWICFNEFKDHIIIPQISVVVHNRNLMMSIEQKLCKVKISQLQSMLNAIRHMINQSFVFKKSGIVCLALRFNLSNRRTTILHAKKQFQVPRYSKSYCFQVSKFSQYLMWSSGYGSPRPSFCVALPAWLGARQSRCRTDTRDFIP